MLDVIVDFYEKISIIDLIYLILTILSLIKCYKKGFVLSILSMAKWLLAYIITLILFFKKTQNILDFLIKNKKFILLNFKLISNHENAPCTLVINKFFWMQKIYGK